MLVLARRAGERIRIADCIEVVVVGVSRSGKVRLGITAPPDVAIRRDDARKQEPTDRQQPKDRAAND
jgi:carbon storage regulator CsrA